MPRHDEAIRHIVNTADDIISCVPSRFSTILVHVLPEKELSLAKYDCSLNFILSTTASKTVDMFHEKGTYCKIVDVELLMEQF